MAGKEKIVRGALEALADIFVPGDKALISKTPSDQYLSRRLNLQRLSDVEGGDTLFEGKLLDTPQWGKIDDKLDEISQQNQYDMDPDYFDDEGIDVFEIDVLTDTKDKVMGEAYFHYKSDGKFSEEVSPEFLFEVLDDLEVLRTSLGVDKKGFARLLEDSGYGPTTNYYSGAEELKGWGLDASIFGD
tara:strand:+ start:1492 stop:2052 length:561 start_codon:yes stop_codon:yes gene_type:complete